MNGLVLQLVRPAWSHLHSWKCYQCLYSDGWSTCFAVQLCTDGRTLLDTLQMPVSSGSCNSLTAKADYTEGASHILDVVHEVGQHP